MVFRPRLKESMMRLRPRQGNLRQVFRLFKEVQVGKDQEKAQSEKKDSHPKTEVKKNNKLKIRYLYHENIS